MNLVFFDAEDSGRSGINETYCKGSIYFSKNLPILGLNEAIILDMVGDKQLSLPIERYSYKYHPKLVRSLWDRAKELSLSAFKGRLGPAIYDDHMPLNEHAGIPAIDIIDFDGEGGTGLELGSPREDHEDIAKQLTTYRSVSSWINPESPDGKATESNVREWLSGLLKDAVADVASKIERIEDISSLINSSKERVQSLEDFAALGVDLDLLDGYNSATTLIGRISGKGSVKSSLKEAGVIGFVADAKTERGHLCLVVVRNEDADSASKALDSLGFTAVQPPSGKGSPSTELSAEKKNLESLSDEKNNLETSLEDWSSSHGPKFLCGLELLERDFVESTAPTRIAVSKYAFIIDGWVVADRVEEVKTSIGSYCSHIHVDTDVAPKHHGLHGHHDDHNSPSPPIAFGDHGLSKPMELLTDAVGRSDYGKIDPTVFMLFTYPLFFGLMLGDMLYGLMTLGLGGLVYMKTKDSGNEFNLHSGYIHITKHTASNCAHFFLSCLLGI